MKRKETNFEKKIVDLIRESVIVYVKYLEVKRLYRKGQLSFSHIQEFVDDRGKSCLFRLKEMAHELFRNENSVGYREKLFDMLVGYMFHEAMKVRENLYQIEFYQPRLSNIASHRKETLEEIQILMRKTKKRLRDGIREIGILMKELTVQIADLLTHYKENYLVPRFLFEEERNLMKIFGKRKFEDMIKTLCGNGRSKLIFKAAMSYLQSEYYDEARRLFKKYMLIDREDDKVLFFFRYASAFYFYFKNQFKKACSFAEEAISTSQVWDTKEYKRHLVALVNDIKKERKK